MRCTGEYHSNYKNNYIDEYDKAYCDPPFLLCGESCSGCERSFVSNMHCNPETEFCPCNAGTNMRGVHYCKGVTTDGCKVMYCHGCYFARLEKCGVSPGSPSKLRGVGRPDSYKD